MLNLIEVDRIANSAAQTALKGIELTEVHGEPTTDWEGRDALLITIVMRTGMEAKVTGNAVAQALVRIHRDLSLAGDERFPYIEFATEDEMLKEMDDDS